MFDIGVPELIVILLIVLVLFGGDKLPQLGKSLGEAIKEVRKGLREESPKETVKKKKS